MANTYTLIASNTLGATAASVTFSAIPADLIRIWYLSFQLGQTEQQLLTIYRRVSMQTQAQIIPGHYYLVMVHLHHQAEEVLKVVGSLQLSTEIHLRATLLVMAKCIFLITYLQQTDQVHILAHTKITTQRLI
jgi:hypothetical protein